MKGNRGTNYGIDAPLAVRNLLIVAGLGMISLITRLLACGQSRTFSQQSDSR